jgi:hypothetical protein
MESSTQVTALLQKSYKKGTRRHKKSVHRNIVSPSPSSSGRERMADLRATVASIKSARHSSTRTSSSTRATISKQRRTLGGDRTSLRRENGMMSADQDRNPHEDGKNSVRLCTFKPL